MNNKISFSKFSPAKIQVLILASAFIVSGFGLIGCAVKEQNTTSSRIDNSVVSGSDIQRESPADQSIAGTETRGTVDIFKSNTSIKSNMVFPAEKGKIGLNLAKGENTEKVVLVSGGSDLSAYKKFWLSNPRRLVIDVPNVKSSKSGNFKLNELNTIDAIRISQKDSGSRFVLDVTNSKDNNWTESFDKATVEGRGNSIEVTFLKPKITTDPNFQVAEIKKEAKDYDTKVEDVAVADLEGKTDSHNANMFVKLQGLEFAKGTSNSGSPQVIVATFEEQANNGSDAHHKPLDFTLRKTAPSEYVLKVRKAELSEKLSAPLVSDSINSPIRSARTVSKDDDVLVRIFAKPEVTLKAESKANTIEIVAIPLVDAIKSEAESGYRAQFAPEAKDAPDAGKVPESKADVKVKDSDVANVYEETTGKYTGRLISLDLQDTDIDNALRIIAEVSNLNIIASEDVAGKVTLRLIDVPWDQALDVILKTNNLDKVQDGNVVRIAPIERLKAERESLKQARLAEQELEPIEVKYLKVSYSKASEIKTLIESVLTERGNVAYDERTNQLIVKDIKEGLKNASVLVEKLDLRTPQVLLETQIVEANRNLFRELGSEFGYRYIQSPELGNATGRNFPNSVDFGARVSNPAVGSPNPIQLLLGSADGTKSLSAVLTQIEGEGRARVVSRPSVATINNRPATIKSVEKVRIRLPSGGVSVATGQGANATGQAQTATETIEVGIVLEVTPQASPDYYVLLDVNAKSSTLGITSTDGIPNEIERSAVSSVLVSSGQTFALGGIYKISERDTVNGLPFLKDVPFIGNLFRRSESRGTDEELLFFITPRIVEGSFDDAAMRS